MKTIIKDHSNSAFLLEQGRKKKLLLIFYLETGEEYGKVIDFFDPVNHTPEDITNKFLRYLKEHPKLKAGLDGDHITKWERTITNIQIK